MYKCKNIIKETHIPYADPIEWPDKLIIESIGCMIEQHEANIYTYYLRKGNKYYFKNIESTIVMIVDEKIDMKYGDKFKIEVKY